MWDARNMRQSIGFNLEHVVRHLPGRDASLRWMFTFYGVPLKASVRILHPGRMMGTSERQLWRASGSRVALRTWSRLLVVVFW